MKTFIQLIGLGLLIAAGPIGCVVIGVLLLLL